MTPPREMQPEGLKPCPFCAASDNHWVTDEARLWWVCQACGARGPTAQTAPDAIAAWNRRAPPASAAEQAVAMLRECDGWLEREAMSLLLDQNTKAHAMVCDLLDRLRAITGAAQ